MPIAIVATRWTAILDERVCPLCEALDGMVIAIGDPAFDNWSMPLHPRCRCMWVYLTEEIPEEERRPNFVEPGVDLLKYAPFKILPKAPALKERPQISPMAKEIAQVIVEKPTEAQAPALEEAIFRLSGKRFSIRNIGDGFFLIPILFGEEEKTPEAIIEEVLSLVEEEEDEE